MKKTEFDSLALVFDLFFKKRGYFFEIIIESKFLCFYLEKGWLSSSFVRELVFKPLSEKGLAKAFF